MQIKKTRILLADDHVVVRHGFRMILAAQADMEVVGGSRQHAATRSRGHGCHDARAQRH